MKKTINDDGNNNNNNKRNSCVSNLPKNVWYVK